MEIELMGWIGEDMTDEEIIAFIDELPGQEQRASMRIGSIVGRIDKRNQQLNGLRRKFA